jgi:hypothetical protein
MPIWTDQLQFEPMQFVGTSLTARVGSQLYSCGILPTTNTLVPALLFVVIWNVTGTSAAPGNARVAATSNAVQSTRPALGILIIPNDKNLLFRRKHDRQENQQLKQRVVAGSAFIISLFVCLRRTMQKRTTLDLLKEAQEL